MMTEKQMTDGWFKRYMNAPETMAMYAMIERLSKGKWVDKDRQAEIITNYIIHAERVLQISFEVLVQQGIDLKVKNALVRAYESYLHEQKV